MADGAFVSEIPNPDNIEAERRLYEEIQRKRGSHGVMGLAAALDQALGGLPSTAAQGVQNLYNAAYGKPYSDEITEASKGVARDFARHGPLPEELVRDLIAMPEAFAGAVPGSLGRIPQAQATARGLPAQASDMLGKGENLATRAAMLPEDVADAMQRLDQTVKKMVAQGNLKTSKVRADRASRRRARMGADEEFRNQTLKPIEEKTRLNRVHADIANSPSDDVGLIDRHGSTVGMSSDDLNYELGRRQSYLDNDPVAYRARMMEPDGTDRILGLRVPDAGPNELRQRAPISFEDDIARRYANDPESMAKLLQGDAGNSANVIIAEARAPVRHQFRPQTSALDDATGGVQAGQPAGARIDNGAAAGLPDLQASGSAQTAARTTSRANPASEPSLGAFEAPARVDLTNAGKATLNNRPIRQAPAPNKRPSAANVQIRNIAQKVENLKPVEGKPVVRDSTGRFAAKSDGMQEPIRHEAILRGEAVRDPAHVKTRNQVHNFLKEEADGSDEMLGAVGKAVRRAAINNGATFKRVSKEQQRAILREARKALPEDQRKFINMGNISKFVRLTISK